MTHDAIEAETLLEGLNDPQREAVTATRGPVLVVAGAGSGKTSVLVRRIAYLMAQERVAPWSILAITFTNKAAKEMRERVERLVGNAAADIWVATFHAACVRILRREIQKLGYSPQFTILDTIDQLSAIKRCVADLDYDEKRYPPRALLAAISAYKNDLISPEQAETLAKQPQERVTSAVYRSYETLLRAQNALDFDDLILKVVQLFETDPQTLDFYQNKFRYVLVDEYQDTNRVQYRLVRLLAEKHQNLCVVGDSDQSIYKWRGADIRNILSFERDYPEARVIKLEQNYRSTQTILEAANGVIENNAERSKKTLWTSNGQGSPVRFYQASDEREEARFIVDEIYRRQRANEWQFRDVVVLYRTNAQSRVIEERCLSAGLPYRIYGGIKFYERKEIRDILAYLRLMANPDDDLAFTRVVNVPKRGIGAGTLTKLQEFAAAEEVSLFAATQRLDAIGIARRLIQPVEDFASLIRQMSPMQEFLKVTELVETLLERTRYLEEMRREGTLEAQARIENLEEFLSVTREFDETRPDGGLVAFLTDVALVADADQEGGTGEGIAMMTLHSAKGLEFPVVFLAGMEEGVFPHMRALQEHGELEEERRLCYVGVTRARRELYLTNAQTRLLFGQKRSNPASRFVAEIPLHALEEVKPSRPVATSGWTRGTAPGAVGIEIPKSFGADPTISWSVGDLAEHRKWGLGKVVDMSGEGEDAEVTIAFEPPTGLRRLAIKYAPIAKVED